MTKKTQKAFTLVEILMALAVMAMLMAALGVAFNAASKNYSDNADMFKNINTARQSLLRITTDIRTAQGVALIGAGAGEDIDNKRCSLIRADSTNVTYHYNTSTAVSYDSALQDNTLYLIVNAGAGASYVLCENVGEMTFDRAVAGTDVRNVRISMAVSNDDQSLTQRLSTAAVVRRNLE